MAVAASFTLSAKEHVSLNILSLLVGEEKDKGDTIKILSKMFSSFLKSIYLHSLGLSWGLFLEAELIFSSKLLKFCPTLEISYPSLNPIMT